MVWRVLPRLQEVPAWLLDVHVALHMHSVNTYNEYGIQQIVIQMWTLLCVYYTDLYCRMVSDEANSS